MLFLSARACVPLRATDVDVILCLQCKCIDPDNQGAVTGPKCGVPDYKGDGNCDDENNNEGCYYDGGDCCQETVVGGQVKTKYCTKV